MAKNASTHIQQWIRQLDDDKFDVRERATQELQALGSEARPALQEALEAKPSPETRRRLDTLLSSHEDDGECRRLRLLRCVRALENIGSKGAHEVLEHLAQSDPESQVGQAAKAALDRIRRKRGQRELFSNNGRPRHALSLQQGKQRSQRP